MIPDTGYTTHVQIPFGQTVLIALESKKLIKRSPVIFVYDVVRYDFMSFHGSLSSLSFFEIILAFKDSGRLATEFMAGIK